MRLPTPLSPAAGKQAPSRGRQAVAMAGDSRDNSTPSAAQAAVRLLSAAELASDASESRASSELRTCEPPRLPEGVQHILQRHGLGLGKRCVLCQLMQPGTRSC